jgi:hypothetical protein
MTTASFKMMRQLIACTVFALILGSCTKNDPPHNNEVSQYSSEVLEKWMNMQLRLMKNATGIQNQAFSRHYAYSGITAVEAVAPGLPLHTSFYRRWNGLTGLPVANRFYHYYYPANVNAAMASINRSMFPNANAADKAAIDSLETALITEFLATQSATRVQKSAEFGKAVAVAVYNWAETDGYKNANAPYTIPVGPGLWERTPPANANPAAPYWGNNRSVVTGSTQDVHPGAPTPYSTETNSPFYLMAKQVYDVRNNLTEEQKIIAKFWIDLPGVSAPGHWLSILQQVVRKTNSKLDKAAMAYALTGSAINDAVICGWKWKYHYNTLRPVTYIRNVMEYTTWESFIGTPPHPEYPSGHSVIAGAAAHSFEKMFGNIGTITDHTYVYMGFSPRTYASFEAIAKEAAQSRLYGGIHFQPALDAGLAMGKKVSSNIFKHGKR